MKRLAPLVLLALLGALAPRSGAQERSSEGVAPVASSSATAALSTSTLAVSNVERALLDARLARAVAGTRDPFATSARMRERADVVEPRAASSTASLPKLSLRGYIEAPGKPAAALIEVEGQGVYLVRSGDTIGVTLQGKASSLKVVSVEASSARVEAGSLQVVVR